MNVIGILFLFCVVRLSAAEISVYVGYDTQWPLTKPALGFFSDSVPLIDSTDVVSYSIKPADGRAYSLGKRVIREMPLLSIQLSEAGAEKIRKYRNGTHEAEHMILFIDNRAVASRELIGADKDMRRMYFKPALYLSGVTQSVLQMGIPEDYIKDGELKGANQ